MLGEQVEEESQVQVVAGEREWELAWELVWELASVLAWELASEEAANPWACNSPIVSSKKLCNTKFAFHHLDSCSNYGLH